MNMCDNIANRTNHGLKNCIMTVTMRSEVVKMNQIPIVVASYNWNVRFVKTTVFDFNARKLQKVTIEIR